MKIPVAPEGKREIGIAVAGAVGWGVLCWLIGWPILGILGAVALTAVLLFFRDPVRRAPTEPGLILAAADGRVTHVHRIETEPLIGGPAMRVSIFLSVANAHINRAPCAGRVVSTKLREGLYLDARDEYCADKNCCNTVTIAPDRPIGGPIIVRQLVGKIARRIVCNVGPGDTLAAGEKFGMIKFGSRTDVIIPEQPGLEIVVEVGQKLKAGTSVLARISQPREKSEPIEPAMAGVE